MTKDASNFKKMEKLGALIFAAAHDDMASFEQAVQMVGEVAQATRQKPKDLKKLVAWRVLVIWAASRRKSFKKTTAIVQATGFLAAVDVLPETSDREDGVTSYGLYQTIKDWFGIGGGSDGGGGNPADRCQEAMDAVQDAIDDMRRAEEAYNDCLKTSGGLGGGSAPGGIAQVLGMNETGGGGSGDTSTVDCSELLERWGDLSQDLSDKVNDMNNACP